MREITRGDSALVDYLQRALGACLSGAPNDHWLMFWYGAGSNGKNTLGQLVMAVMGDYAKKILAAAERAQPIHLRTRPLCSSETSLSVSGSRRALRTPESPSHV
jgi:hypothetical protein